VAYFKGYTYGHYLGGLLAVAASEDGLAPAAAGILHRYIDGYVLPTARMNPFALPANGIFADGRPRWFSGIRHGMNGSFALLAADLLHAARVLNRPELVPLGQQTALWIAGVNPGVRARDDAPYHGISCHYGEGQYSADCWTHIPGAVSNGFSTGPQFTLHPVGSPEDDRPTYWHDEDWILHSGAVLALQAELT
jgi:hypothetical protein